MMNWLWLVISLLCSFYVLPTNPVSLSIDLEKCLKYVIDKYFIATSTLVYDVRKATPPDLRRSLELPRRGVDINQLLRMVQDKGKRWVLVNNNSHESNINERQNWQKPQSSIFIIQERQVDNWRAVTPLFYQIKETEHWNRQGRTLVVINKVTTNENDGLLAQNAIAALWQWNKAINVVAAIAHKDRLDFYTWFPYQQPTCRWVPELTVYDTWHKDQFKYNKNLYPEKIERNLHGCPIRVAADDCYPYTFKNYTEGFESSLVRTMADKLNFTMQKESLPKGENLWMTEFENGTTAGAVGVLDRQKVDIAYACLMLSIERYVSGIEFLPTYYHDSLTWFVPTPDRRSHASNIFEAFPGEYWIYIFITTVSALLVFVIIGKLEEITLTSPAPKSIVGAMLRVLAMAVSSPFVQNSKQSTPRLFTFIFALYSLHITTIYQASLYNLYKADSYTNIYKTLEDAVYNNLFFWLKESTRNMYNSDSKDSMWKTILQKNRHGFIEDVDNWYDVFDDVAIRKSAALLFIKSTMLVYINEDYLDESRQPQILYISEQFASYPVTMFLSPGHPLLHFMTELVQNILSSGFVQHWYREVVPDAKIGPPTMTNVSLQLEHISGAFMLYLALIVLASCIFLLENVYWLTHRDRQQPHLLRKERNIRRQVLLRVATEIGRESLRKFRAKSGRKR